ncbi:methyltransferase family protein [Telluribacter humicola]|uniref:methyltransferase family protein n=1 Tax=Telluribacter humicola TaxID=1720261 RepID=UPI001A96A08A|nr:isoprenylcysteine carboxylmethyltransferase family protein [Telluribacter humicola]
MEVPWIEWAYYVTLVCELLLLGCLVWSLIYPGQRIWPPPGRRSWQFWMAWVLTLLAWIGYNIVFFSYFDTSQATLSLRLWTGIPLLVLGAGLALWGVYSLGTINSLGIKGQLIDRGAYRFSRNPQYTGDALLITGMMILCGSERFLLMGCIAALCFVIAPFTEEPWLQAEYGQPYITYKKKVRRFL